jgi:nucleotide-binding universal stress UspA family protein
MSIVCGVDFSESSKAVLSVASRLAGKLRVPLHLVHAIDGAPTETGAIAQGARVRLEELAKSSCRAAEKIEYHVHAGTPDEVTLRIAKETSAELILVGALGHRQPDEWQLGSHADRVAERAHVPVLVMRSAEPFINWLNGNHKLKIVLGVDASASAETAGRWVLQLARWGECEVVLTHLYWPPEELHRLGFGGARGWVDDAELEQALQREYGQRFSALFDAASVSCRFEPHVGRLGDGLAALAVKERADLVVVGCHDRGLLARVWHGSVSRHVLRCASMSVACIPAPLQAEQRAAPAIRNVLVATDFSKIGNAAIPLAYSVVAYGGTVHLMHVIEAGRDPLDAYDVFVPPVHSAPELLEKLRAQLAALVPKDLTGSVTDTRLHVLEAPSAKTAIYQAAERFGVDLICLGTHGRTGIGRTLLGSVAASVLEQTHRPVLLARGPLE